MNKLEYISRQLARAEKKKFEHYVITRIWHLLNDTEIKFVTQQCVSRPEGKALTDMYFPQLEIHVEIDEGHHKAQIRADKLREADIINATGHKILRVDVTKSIEEVNKDVEAIIKFIIKKREGLHNFKPWDFEAERSPHTYIKRGYIDLKDDVAFQRIVDAVNCFGLNYKGCQRAGAKHPNEQNTLIWLPKLYENQDWNNQISDDGKKITEISKILGDRESHLDRCLEDQRIYRIVFARVKSPLGDVMYRFKGKFKLNREVTNYKNGVIWERIATRVKTYAGKN